MQKEQYRKIKGNFRDKTPEQKENAWHKIIDKRMNFYAHHVEKNPAIKEQLGQLFKLEFSGGECWICKTEWKPQEFDNKYLAGKYYIPQCECFIRCPVCKTNLYDSQFIFGRKLTYCDNCGFKLKIQDGKGKTLNRFGNEYELFYNDLNLKQQYEQRRR